MTFTNPTTADEMYATLQQIFYFYRIKKEPYSGVTLVPLEIDRLTFTPLTDEQLLAKAARNCIAPLITSRVITPRAT